MEEMVKLFTLEAVNKSGSVFNKEKLDWVNQQHMQAMPADELGQRLKPYAESVVAGAAADAGKLAAVAELHKDRVSTLKQMAEESHYFFKAPSEYDAKAAAKQLTAAATGPLSEIRNRLAKLEGWEPAAIEQEVKSVVEDLGIGFGKLGLPLRVALTGNTKSPALEQTVAVIGRDESVARLDAALEYVSGLA